MNAGDITFIVRIQTIISAVLALIVILAVSIPTVIGIKEGTIPAIPQVFVDWGGVIIGFYFGTFLTQIGGLLNGDKKKQQEPPPPPVEGGGN